MPTGVRDLTALGPDISIGFYVHNATIVRPLNQFQIFDHDTVFHFGISLEVNKVFDYNWSFYQTY